MSKILVTGATGQLGRIVVDELLKRIPASDLSVMVRNPANAEIFKNSEVTVSIGDYKDYDSLVAAFKGIEKLYFVSSSELADRLTQHQNVVRAAVEAKVGHIFYTSAQRKTQDGTSAIASIADAHWQTDNLIVDSGLTYTILKHPLYTDLLPMFLGEKVIEAGSIYLPAGDGRAAYATRQDLAEAGAVVLTTSGHENKIYELGSKETYSFHFISGILSGLMGYLGSIEYISPPVGEFRQRLTALGLTQETVDGIASFCTAIAQGEFDNPSDDLEALLGHETQSVKEFLKTEYNFSSAPKD